MAQIWTDIAVWISSIDGQLLLAVNGLHSAWVDQLMWILSKRYVWVPLYLLLAFCVFRRTSWQRAVVCLVFIGLTIAATDQTCASLLRPLAERLRPSNPNNPVASMVHIVNGYRGGRYGFPSCHAANTFALAVFLSLFFRRRWATAGLMVWSVLVSISRIFLGVHYPGDILGGMVVGAMFALIFYYLYLAAFQIGRLQSVFKSFPYRYGALGRRQ